MKRRESPTAAAQREIEEEVNCKLVAPRLLEFEDTEYWGRRYTTFVVGAFCGMSPEPDLREINEAAFFSLTDLPEPISEPTRARLERWRQRSNVSFEVPAFVRVDYVQKLNRPPRVATQRSTNHSSSGLHDRAVAKGNYR
jgi:8-oxo-dGTP pyrophosphatase MutT (NUDIX family)